MIFNCENIYMDIGCVDVVYLVFYVLILDKFNCESEKFIFIFMI